MRTDYSVYKIEVHESKFDEVFDSQRCSSAKPNPEHAGEGQNVPGTATPGVPTLAALLMTHGGGGAETLSYLFIFIGSTHITHNPYSP